MSVYGVTSPGPIVMSCLVQAEVAPSIRRTERERDADVLSRRRLIF
jgi:hypothetical protein